MAIQTINPATGEVVKTFDEFTKEQVTKIIDDAHKAFLNWRKTNFAGRKELMFKAAEVLRNNKKKYAEIMTIEMGKAITQSLAEVEKCAWVCEYYAENAEHILNEEIIKTDASKSYVRFDSIGIVLAVMPWNFPFWQVFRFAAPALMAGNVGLLKHASNVPMCAFAIEEVFTEAGFPNNTFKTLLIGSSLVDDIIKNPKVKAATLTGSEPAGKKVAQTCGNELKKTVLELGGSDPFIVLADADINEAVKVGIAARMLNNGQSCIAAKRFIVEEEIADEFEKKFVEGMEKVKVGDPMDPRMEQGSMAREDLLIELHEQVKKSIEAGAKLLIGGERFIPADLSSEARLPKYLYGGQALAKEGAGIHGAFYKPTVLSNVNPGMPAYNEEMFGPVASIIRAKDETDAIRIANDSEFGLGASLWTNDLKKAEKLAAEIESGSVFINGLVKSDPRLPFGGVKTSGYGRELSHYGIKEFVNIKTVWIK